MEKKLSILIPVYNQLALTRRCLSYLTKQTYKDFIVILQDDASQSDYQDLIKEFSDLEIHLDRHEKNLGAIGNMIYCLTKDVPTEFIMCLHEDDFIQSEYLEKSLAILEKNNNIAFVASPAYFFDAGQNFKELPSLRADWQKYNTADLVAYILNGNKIAFGSIIYRRSLIKPEYLNLEKYGVLLDRPFLLSITTGSQKEAAILKDPYYYYQNHPYPDKRWATLSLDNIVNLYANYENLAPGKGRAITSQYIFNFASLENKKWSDFRRYLKRGRENGLISWCRISWKFMLASLFIFLFGQKNYYRLFKFVKNI